MDEKGICNNHMRKMITIHGKYDQHRQIYHRVRNNKSEFYKLLQKLQNEKVASND